MTSRSRLSLAALPDDASSSLAIGSTTDPSAAGASTPRSILRLVSVLFALSVLSPFASGAEPAGLVSYWTADGNASDSADGNHGTLFNGTGFAPGKFGQGGRTQLNESPDFPGGFTARTSLWEAPR